MTIKMSRGAVIVLVVMVTTASFSGHVMANDCVSSGGCDDSLSPFSSEEEVCMGNHGQQIEDICRSDGLSCRNRCARTRNTGVESYQPLTCHCGAECLLYGDCCHDFKDYCPSQQREFHARFAHLKPAVKCLNETYAVFDSCWEKTDTNLIPVKDHEKHLLSSDVVVTDALTGFHYTNYTIFSCNRQPGSQPILWNKAVKIDPAATMSKPNPPSGVRPRVCRDSYILCLDVCRIKGNTAAFRQMCRNIENYKRQSVNGTKNQEDSMCRLRGGDEIKDFTEFSILSEISMASARTEIIKPFAIARLAWGEAECFDGIGEGKCHVTECSHSHFMFDRHCYFPSEIVFSLEFANSRERELYDQRKLFAELNQAWLGLRDNYTSTFDSSNSAANQIIVVYSVRDVWYLPEDGRTLPFTKLIVSVLEKTLGLEEKKEGIEVEEEKQVGEEEVVGDEENVSGNQTDIFVIPRKAKICVTARLDHLIQIENIFREFKVTNPKDQNSYRLVCDVITMSNTTQSSSDWVIRSDLRNLNSSEGAMQANSGASFAPTRRRPLLDSLWLTHTIAFIIGLASIHGCTKPVLVSD